MNWAWHSMAWHDLARGTWVKHWEPKMCSWWCWLHHHFWSSLHVSRSDKVTIASGFIRAVTFQAVAMGTSWLRLQSFALQTSGGKNQVCRSSQWSNIEGKWSLHFLLDALSVVRIGGDINCRPRQPTNRKIWQYHSRYAQIVWQFPRRKYDWWITWPAHSFFCRRRWPCGIWSAQCLGTVACQLSAKPGAGPVQTSVGPTDRLVPWAVMVRHFWSWYYNLF